ncbi:MAG: hypothetical protein CVT92_04500 [Bacteroidetes bacterium HGW-Bacteroidetes-1]|jgi:iron only hydrogenase large subunit-like protein|nr:MAG: hypothetical protein CVT92_04500 [Bacteroidetes bacterium HGW-Bacteroidetes-1]
MNTINRPKENLPIVYTSKAKCRDCYRCVRVCPVNAIRMKDGQAEVITEICIACGTCISACPQQAKAYRTDYEKVIQMIEDGDQMALSLAPSFVVRYNDWEQKRLPSALRMLGFHYVGETSVGAWHTAVSTASYIKDHPERSHICTACPAVVSYVLHETPSLSVNLVPIVSPMIAHARMLKTENPKRKVVFAGPCVAKKDEAQWNKNKKLVDAVLTFDELDELLKLKNINIERCEESSFNEQVPGNARLFPIEGGLLRTADLSTDMLDAQIIAVSGYQEVNEVLSTLMEKGDVRFIIEPLFCKNGCINGPFSKQNSNSFLSRAKVLDFAKNYPGLEAINKKLYNSLSVSFAERSSLKKKSYSEEQIKEVLKRTGKLLPTDELNCTACGYASCRDKAIAVLDGIAESEMCMPYMRRLAEQKFDTMIDRDPNGIILLNNELQILHMNPAFKKMFTCSDSLLTKSISYLIDPDPFEKLSTGKDLVVKQIVHYGSYNLICHLIAYSLPEDNNFVGVFVDVTDSQVSKEKLTEIKSETVIKAHELIEHQISMAQELAKFLGENTARGEILMKNLIDSIKK